MDPLRLAELYLDAGARILQLRAKQEAGADLLRMADALVALAGRYAARAVVNDRVDVALMAGAAGVHLGQDDLPPPVARGILPVEAIVGVSTHTRTQIDAARQGPVSYIAVGPVFSTATKETGYEAVGLPLIRYAAQGSMPVVAIGGLTPERAARAIEAGASGVAVISDLLATGDPGGRVRDYLGVLP